MKIVAAVLFTLFLVVTPAGATVIEFDGLTAGWGPDALHVGGTKGTSPVTTQYVSSGVLLSVASGASTDYISSAGFVPCGGSPSGLTCIGNWLAFNTIPVSGTAGTLTIQFVQPGNASVLGTVAAGGLSFYIEDSEMNKLATFYDILGNSIGSFHLTFVGATASIASSTPVNKIVITDTNGDGFMMDQLTFGNINSAPEPGTLALLGAGLVALGLVSRRFRSR